MCTLVILRRPGHEWPVLLAANRDEMADRPWRPPARHWPERPRVTAGLDEQAGSTWLGLNTSGVAAGVLNRLHSLGPRPGYPSRGELPLKALDHATAAAAAGKWRKRMARSARARVSLAWQGDPRYPNNRRRSPGLEPFLPLFETPGVDFYSVQTGPGMEALGQHRLGGMVEDLGPELGDFADTAAAFVNLDLLITSDTAVPHLAGALGKPVWLVLPYVPDWRWLMEGEKSPWYPTMRLFRQTSPGDWDGVFDRVARALLEICRGGAVTPPDQRGMRGKP